MKQLKDTDLIGSSDTDPLPSQYESDMSFSDKLYIEHSKKQYKCPYSDCGMIFIRQDAHDRHEYSHTGVKKYNCLIENCNNKYTNKSHLKRHLRTAHNSNPVTLTKTKCKHDTCYKEFANEYSMKKHYKIMHLGLKMIKCSSCEESFYRKSQLKAHLFKHTGKYPYNCEQCGAGALSYKLFERHKLSHKTYKCPDCDKVLDKWSLLLLHRKNEHKPICEICKQAFSSLTNKQLHMKTHEKTDDRDVFQCTYGQCTKFYFHFKNLRAHIRSKHGDTEKKFQCTECSSQLATKQKLNQHMRMHRDGKKVNKPKVKIERRRRKDAGVQKKTTAAKLTQVIVEPMVEKMILAGEGKDVQLMIYSSKSESEMDDSSVVLVAVT